MLTLTIKNKKPFHIRNPENIHTPRLLVFRDRVLQNIESMKKILNSTFPETGFRHLCCHLKTNKSSSIIKMMINEGIHDVKVTLNEAQLAAECGCRTVFIAYPLLENGTRKACELMKHYSGTQFILQAGCREHAGLLAAAASSMDVRIPVMIDSSH